MTEFVLVTDKRLSLQQLARSQICGRRHSVKLAVDGFFPRHYPGPPVEHTAGTQPSLTATIDHLPAQVRGVYGARDRDQVQGLFPLVSFHRVRPVPPRHTKAPTD